MIYHATNAAASPTPQSISDSTDSIVVTCDSSNAGTGRAMPPSTPDNGDIVIQFPSAASNDGVSLTVQRKATANGGTARVFVSPFSGEKISNSANQYNQAALNSPTNGCSQTFISDGTDNWITACHN